MDINASNPLDPALPSDIAQGTTDPAVLGAIDVIYRSWTEKSYRDNKNIMISQMLEQGFSVQNPSGTRKMDALLLQQAIWRMANRMKPLDYQVHAPGKSEAHERVVTSAVGQVIEDGGYLACLRDKNGAYSNLLPYGDSFVMVGTSDNKKLPIKFSVIPNSNVYVDPYATVMRSVGPGRSVGKMLIVQSMSYAQMLHDYPLAKKKKCGPGKIPRDVSWMKETGRSFIQSTQLDKNYTEVAHLYDIENKVYCTFIGAACTVYEKLEGDEYPFMLNDEPYIPVLHYYFWPATEGFWNHGIGDMLYKLAVITRRLMNMAIGHVEDNTYPITLVNVPNQEVTKFFNKLTAAHQMRAVGKKGYVAMEYDPANPNSSRVTADQLLTQSLMSDWEAIYARLEDQVQKLGINLNELSHSDSTTATQIMMEEESQNALIKQIGEYNATEYKFAVQLTMDFMKKFVKKNNDTPVQLTTAVKLEADEPGEKPMETKIETITLGMVADELRKTDYFVRINARTGAIPSNMMQQAQVSRMMQVTTPGTKAFSKLQAQLAQLNDRDLAEEDFTPPQQAAPPGDMQPVPTEGGEVPDPNSAADIQNNLEKEPAL